MRRDLHPADRFHLEIDGISTGSFVACSGLGARVEVLEVVEGGSGVVRRLRGDVSYSSIVFEKGVVRDLGLYDWFRQGTRRDGAVVLISTEGREVLRWLFSRGWPCRYEGPRFDAWASEVAVEVLEIVHEGLTCIER